MLFRAAQSMQEECAVERERRACKDRKLSDSGDVPTPTTGVEGLPIPASQDRLKNIS